MEDTETEFYEISAVARLTGVSTHVLRVWERRYGVVEPDRSKSRRRQYSQSDVQRLTLLKSLVDRGHSIGSVAKLSTEQLHERMAEVLACSPKSEGGETPLVGENCRIVVIGKLIRDAVREATDLTASFSIVGEFVDIPALGAALKVGACDLVIIETETLFAEDVVEIKILLDQLEISRAIVVYRFAKDDVIPPRDRRRITALRVSCGRFLDHMLSYKATHENKKKIYC